MANPNIYFDYLDTYDLRIMRILDLSEWNDFEEVTAYIEILAPGRKTPSTYEIEKGKINIFNSNSIEITCSETYEGLVPLPDGIYKIRVFVCNEDTVIEQSSCYLRTTKAMLRLDKILMKANLSGCCEGNRGFLNKYSTIEMLIKSAHANVRDGNLLTGKRDFDVALEMLEEFENCVEDNNC